MATTRQLPERTNRGKRTRELIGEEKEIDEMFWKTNGVYVDLVDDEDYEVEPEKEDKFDEDFWDSESSSADEEADERQAPDPSRPKKPPKPEGKKPRKPSRRLKIAPQLSQRELLEEAASTEMWNQYKLTQMMKFEEAKSQRFGLISRKLPDPVIRTIDSSRSGRRKVTLIYSTASPFTPMAKPAKPEPSSKYRDPRSGLPFSDTAEFRSVRNSFLVQQEADLQARIKTVKEALAKKREALEQFDAKYNGR